MDTLDPAPGPAPRPRRNTAKIVALVVAGMLLAGCLCSGGVIGLGYLIADKANAQIEAAKVSRAKLEIKALEKAVLAYQLKYGIVPESLDMLTELQPDGSAATLRPEALIDPWRNRYIYEPATVDPATGTPLIYTNGPPSTNEAIKNWDMK